MCWSGGIPVPFAVRFWPRSWLKLRVPVLYVLEWWEVEWLSRRDSGQISAPSLRAELWLWLGEVNKYLKFKTYLPVLYDCHRQQYGISFQILCKQKIYTAHFKTGHYQMEFALKMPHRFQILNDFDTCRYLYTMPVHIQHLVSVCRKYGTGNGYDSGHTGTGYRYTYRDIPRRFSPKMGL
jgi:hypothetical protein